MVAGVEERNCIAVASDTFLLGIEPRFAALRCRCLPLWLRTSIVGAWVASVNDNSLTSSLASWTISVPAEAKRFNSWDNGILHLRRDIETAVT